MSTKCLSREIKKNANDAFDTIVCLITATPKAILAIFIGVIPIILIILALIQQGIIPTTTLDKMIFLTFVYFGACALEMLWLHVFAIPIVNCYIYPEDKQENAPAGS